MAFISTNHHDGSILHTVAHHVVAAVSTLKDLYFASVEAGRLNNHSDRELNAMGLERTALMSQVMDRRSKAG